MITIRDSQNHWGKTTKWVRTWRSCRHNGTYFVSEILVWQHFFSVLLLSQHRNPDQFTAGFFVIHFWRSTLEHRFTALDAWLLEEECLESLRFFTEFPILSDNKCSSRTWFDKPDLMLWTIIPEGCSFAKLAFTICCNSKQLHGRTQRTCAKQKYWPWNTDHSLVVTRWTHFKDWLMNVAKNRNEIVGSGYQPKTRSTFYEWNSGEEEMEFVIVGRGDVAVFAVELLQLRLILTQKTKKFDEFISCFIPM